MGYLVSFSLFFAIQSRLSPILSILLIISEILIRNSILKISKTIASVLWDINLEIISLIMPIFFPYPCPGGWRFFALVTVLVFSTSFLSSKNFLPIIIKPIAITIDLVSPILKSIGIGVLYIHTVIVPMLVSKTLKENVITPTIHRIF